MFSIVASLIAVRLTEIPYLLSKIDGFFDSFGGIAALFFS